MTAKRSTSAPKSEDMVAPPTGVASCNHEYTLEDMQEWLQAETDYETTQLQAWLDAEHDHELQEWLQAAAEEALLQVNTSGAALVKTAATFAEQRVTFIADLQVVFDNDYSSLLGYASFVDFAQATIARVFGESLPSDLRNELIVSLRAMLPAKGADSVNQTVIGDIVGTDKGTVSRTLKAAAAGVAAPGSGDAGHGGPRTPSTPKAPVDVAVSTLEKVQIDSQPWSGNDLRTIRIEALRVVMETTKKLGEDWSEYLSELAVMAENGTAAELHSASEGNNSRTGEPAA